MTAYSIGIVAHRDRELMADELARKVKPALILIDDGSLGCAGNHTAVQESLASRPGWSVVLEDDAVPLGHFHRDLRQVLELTPSPIVGLYLGTGYPAQWQGRIQRAVNENTSFILCPRLLHAVGYAIAPDIKQDLATWMGARGRRGPGMAPDEAIGVWANANGIKVAYTNPSLVDHRDQGTVIKARSNNFAPGRNRPRKAWATTPRRHWDDSAIPMGYND